MPPSRGAEHLTTQTTKLLVNGKDSVTRLLGKKRKGTGRSRKNALRPKNLLAERGSGRKPPGKKAEEVQRKERERRIHAETTSRAFGAWVKRTADLSTEEWMRIGHIPHLPAVSGISSCSRACEEAQADLGIAFCRHIMEELVETYTTVNKVEKGKFVRNLVRIWHPDNQKFIKSEQRLRQQAAELTKILNGMLLDRLRT